MNVLAIDQGTSATKALLVGPAGDRAREVLGRGEVPVHTRSVGADGVDAGAAGAATDPLHCPGGA